jgi:DNA-binding IclR family transcriptional regulator
MAVRVLTTAVKCLETLELIADLPDSARLAELARLAGESRATMYQRLFTLVETGWVERLPDDTYRLSLKACRIAAAALTQAGLGERVQPLLDELAEALGDTVSLVMLQQERLIISQRAEGRGVLRADLRVGAELSYKDSASGAIWLAFGPSELAERLSVAGVSLPNRKRINAVRADRVSMGGGGETLPGISAIAVPVLDRRGVCLASLSVSSPEARFKPKKFLRTLQSTAGRLAEMLTD